VGPQSREDGVEEHLHLARHDEIAPGEQPLQEDDAAVEVGGRDDREPLADQGVVGVVPLRPLRVHPDAALGNQVGQLDEQQQEQLLGHRHVDDRAVRALEQACIGPLGRHRRRDAPVERVVELDGVVRVVEHGRVWRDAVGHVRVAEDPTLEQRFERARVEAHRDLQQLLQVDDLVVAPIADVGPRVARLGHLPLDAVAGDPVGVVAVGGGRAEEDADHPVDEPGERVRERLPVLEDVAPVALVVEPQAAVAVAHVDREAVPGAAGVAVAPTEGERQVRAAEPLEVGVPHLDGARHQLVVREGRRQGVEEGALGLEHAHGCACGRRRRGRRARRGRHPRTRRRA
jgi:hypothetical protein